MPLPYQIIIYGQILLFYWPIIIYLFLAKYYFFLKYCLEMNFILDIILTKYYFYCSKNNYTNVCVLRFFVFIKALRFPRKLFNYLTNHNRKPTICMDKIIDYYRILLQFTLISLYLWCICYAIF